MKRIVAIVLALIMAFSLVSCSGTKNAGGEGVISPTSKDGKPVLTIVLNEVEYKDLMKTDYIGEYIDKFEGDFGVDIKLQRIMSDPHRLITAEDVSEYNKKLFTKLITKDGPELVFAQYMSLEPLIRQGAVLDVKGKVDNIDKIYDTLVEDKVYYVPIGMNIYTRALNRETLKQLGADALPFDWTSKDYFTLKDRWISSNTLLFSQLEYYEVFEGFIDMESLYNEKDNTVKLNTPEVRQKLRDIRSYIFSGKYKLTNGYKYGNYYNMIFEDKSPEFKLGYQYFLQNKDNGNVAGGLIANIFRARDMDGKIKSFGTVMYPPFKDEEKLMSSYGFLVNKKGKNLNLAYEFINGMLSNEVQMHMFENESNIHLYYPVNKEIEADILKLEARTVSDPNVIELKKYALQQLKDGKFKLYVTMNPRFYGITSMILKDLAKFTLADEPYSDEALQAELKKLEGKYNVLLNE